MSYADYAMDRAVRRAVRLFGSLNKDKSITEADRDRLKETYVRKYLEPEAQRLLRLKLKQEKEDEEFTRRLRTPGRP